MHAVWNGAIMWPGKDEDKDMVDRNMHTMGWGKFSA